MGVMGRLFAWRAATLMRGGLLCFGVVLALLLA